MSVLLIVHHSPTPATASLCEAVVAGAHDDAIDNVDIRVVQALEASVADVMSADGYLLGTPANFGYISGALKHFFDTTYNAVREPTAKRPFSYWIHGGYDTTGAERAMESITTGLGWRLAASPLVFTSTVEHDHLDSAYELGASLAAQLA